MIDCLWSPEMSATRPLAGGTAWRHLLIPSCRLSRLGAGPAGSGILASIRLIPQEVADAHDTGRWHTIFMEVRIPPS